MPFALRDVASECLVKADGKMRNVCLSSFFFFTCSFRECPEGLPYLASNLPLHPDALFYYSK